VFVGKFEDIIPFSKKECENYIEVVKEALKSHKNHDLSNFELTLHLKYKKGGLM